jgi:hypothetical protein
MAHADKEAISRLADVAEGVDVISCPNQACEVCLLSKAKRKISQRPPERASKPFECVRFDLIQMSEADNGDKRVIHFLCDATGCHAAYTHAKADLRKYVGIYLARVQRQFGTKPKRLYSDQERTLGDWYIERCQNEGIQIEHSVYGLADQNGRIESARENIVIMARSMLIGSRLPSKLWHYAIQAAVYLDNRRPRRDRDPQKELQRRMDRENGSKPINVDDQPTWTTSYEKLYGKKPDLSNLRVYGCREYVGMKIFRN